MINIVEQALEERRKYKEVSKELVILSISNVFSTNPYTQRIEFFMDMPVNMITPYRDNPLITDIKGFNLNNEIMEDGNSKTLIGDLNLVLNLCGMCLLDLFSCGKVTLNREHYIR
jgi:hypothetical protein